jgi:hypothetical protein
LGRELGAIGESDFARAGYRQRGRSDNLNVVVAVQGAFDKTSNLGQRKAIHGSPFPQPTDAA